MITKIAPALQALAAQQSAKLACVPHLSPVPVLSALPELWTPAPPVAASLVLLQPVCMCVFRLKYPNCACTGQCFFSPHSVKRSVQSLFLSLSLSLPLRVCVCVLGDQASVSRLRYLILISYLVFHVVGGVCIN